jgi:hypothetical protein
MKRLELKHLAAYLPYSIKVYHADWNAQIDMNATGAGNNYFSIEDVIEFSPMVKPALLPLSELALTTPIIIKGSEMSAEVKPSDYIATSIKDSQKNMRMLLNDNAEGLEQWKFERLLQLHFDVFNLIDAGLAINKHQL